tara:strand:- start:10944 stop:11978 length:1035 start_codon:yes stop_codon:yes gene_type:complete
VHLKNSIITAVYNREMSSMNTPRVAVITRTKDRLILLERSIKSVHQQTFTDFIHVIYNDGGDKKAVEELVAKYEHLTNGRVKLMYNKESRGPDAAFNVPIKSVDSEFIAIHDDDDSWHPRFLELMVAHLDKTKVKGVIARTDRIYESISNNAIRIQDRDQYMPHLSHFSLYDLFAENFAVPISFMYAREVFKKVGYYDEAIRVSGDWEFVLRFMRFYDIEKVDPGYPLAFYHVRPSNSGILGNSIYDPSKSHVQYHTKLANRFLREDLEKGSLGYGYLFNVGNAERARGWELEEMQRRIHELSDKIDSQAQLIASSKLSLRGVKRAAKEKLKNTARKVKAKIRR